MSSRPVAVMAVGAVLALSGCQWKSVIRPDPNAYTLQFVPESIVLNVGGTSEVSAFATQPSTTGVTDTTDQTGTDNTTSTARIIIRNIEWSVDNGTIASLSGSALAPGGSATIRITCLAGGETSVVGSVTLESEQRLTKSLPVTCAK